LRIIYSFIKKGRFWIVTCPSDKSIKESIYTSLIEAITKFFASRASLEFFDIVIPSSIPNPIKIHKPIRIIKPQSPQSILKPVMPVVDGNEWNKPIPPATIQFKTGIKWVIAIPPYDKQNVFFLNSPLPGTSNIYTGKDSARKTLQIFNGTLEHDIYIDVGFTKVHVFLIDNELKMDFSTDKSVVDKGLKKLDQLRKQKKSIFYRIKRVVNRFIS
jgi:hypothetical protein